MSASSLCWKYHDIGSRNSGYFVLHVQSGRFSEVITTAPCNRGIAIPVICFGISMDNTMVRRVGGEMWFRRPLGEMTSDGLGAGSDNGEEHVRTVEDGKIFS